MTSTNVPGAVQPAAATTLTANGTHGRRSRDNTILAILLERISSEAIPHTQAGHTYALKMGTKAAKKVDFQRLADALGDYRFAYLVTVDDDYQVHTVTVEPELHEPVMEVGLIGGRTRKNVESRSAVTLLWPPSDPGGYSLIVDGQADVTDADDDTAALRVVPTRALLHRNADPSKPGSAQGCLHDCVVFSKP